MVVFIIVGLVIIVGCVVFGAGIVVVLFYVFYVFIRK